MKIVSNKFYILFIFLFWIMDLTAGNGAGSGPPSPTGKKPPPPPGLAIDENIIVLFILALLFGIYIIYTNVIKARTSA